MASDGATPPRQLALPGASSMDGAFAADGRSIAFAAGKFEPSFRIYLARPDGTDARKLAGARTPDGVAIDAGCFRPIFHPDGRRILFLLALWPEGLFGDPKRALWEVDIVADRARPIADFTLFDDPLGWKPPDRGPGPAP